MNSNDRNKLLLVLVSLAVAIFSYKIVESPLRRSQKLSARPGVVLGMSVALMACAFLGADRWHAAARSWVTLPEQKRFLEVGHDLPMLYSQKCDDWFHSSEVKVCGVGRAEAEKTVVLVGDSISAQWFPVLASIYKRPNWKVLVMTKSGCPMVDEPYFYNRIRREYKECSIWRDSVLDRIKLINPDVIYISNGRYPFNKLQWTNGTGRVLDKIAASTKDVFIIRSTDVLPFDAPECLSRQKWQEKFINWGVNCSALTKNENEQNVYDWLLQVAGKFENVSVIDMNSIICPDGRCYAERDGFIVYRDSQHITASYMKTLAEEFVTEVKKAKNGE